MIGHIAEAKIAAKFGWSGRPDVPEGWRRLGSGCYRVAYLAPSGVVYKVGAEGCDNNAKEARTYKKIKSLNVEGFRVARCRYFKSCAVLAMEYVEDDGSDAEKSMCAMMKFMNVNFNYSDCDSMKRRSNWHAVKGIAVITDYAYGWGNQI